MTGRDCSCQAGCLAGGPGAAGPARSCASRARRVSGAGERARRESGVADAVDRQRRGQAVSPDAALGGPPETLSYDRPADWPPWLQLAVHQRAVWSYLGARLALADLARLAKVSATTAAAFVWAGAYGASEELARLALTDATRLGPDHEAVHELRFRMASAYRLTGRYAEAERKFRQVLAAEERVLGLRPPQHADHTERDRPDAGCAGSA
jgi:hypothetical protein